MIGAEIVVMALMMGAMLLIGGQVMGRKNKHAENRSNCRANLK
jgi:hypothetical protein